MPAHGDLSVLVQAGIGLVALIAMTGPVYAVFELVRKNVSPDFSYSLDPVPLFFLAIVLGFLYQRTHRLLPSLVLHAYFNAIGMTLVTVEVLRQG